METEKFKIEVDTTQALADAFGMIVFKLSRYNCIYRGIINIIKGGYAND